MRNVHKKLRILLGRMVIEEFFRLRSNSPKYRLKFCCVYKRRSFTSDEQHFYGNRLIVVELKSVMQISVTVESDILNYSIK